MSELTPEQIAGEEPSGKIVIYWEREYSTAIAPERLKLDFVPHRPLLSGMSLNGQRTVAVEGYKVIPDDCGPVRTVGQYGWPIRSPADCKIRPERLMGSSGKRRRSCQRSGFLATSRFQEPMSM
jgi:hypothetical protein